MALQTSNNRWDVATTDTQQIFEYKTTFSSLLETRRFSFLGGPNESETGFFVVWNLHNKEWLPN
jgi:hypothetical protein